MGCRVMKRTYIIVHLKFHARREKNELQAQAHWRFYLCCLGTNFGILAGTKAAANNAIDNITTTRNIILL